MKPEPIFDWECEIVKYPISSTCYVSLIEKTRRITKDFKRAMTRYVVAEYNLSEVTCGWGSNQRKEIAAHETKPKAYSNLGDAQKDLHRRINKLTGAK
jgi:hypothetical protein